jgi:flagellar motor switch protein FliG
MKSRENTLRKAAILVASLEPDVADGLLAQMSRAQADAVREAIEMLGSLDPSEQEQVIDEFFRIGPLIPHDELSGIELDSRLAQRLSEHPAEQRAESTGLYGRTGMQPSPPAPPEKPLARLRHASGSQLATRLQYERPQVIAVVISHLAPSSAAEMLACLPSSLQAEVARRLVDLEETAPEILHEIEMGLATLLDDATGGAPRRTAGMQALEQILQAADPFVHNTIVSSLSRHDRHLADRVRMQSRQHFEFAALHDLDDPALAKVFLHVPHETLSLALAGASKSLLSRALRLLPVARAARLRRDLDRLGAMRLADVEAAQSQVAHVASEMEEQGTLLRPAGRKLSVAI